MFHFPKISKFKSILQNFISYKKLKKNNELAILNQLYHNTGFLVLYYKNGKLNFSFRKKYKMLILAF